MAGRYAEARTAGTDGRCGRVMAQSSGLLDLYSVCEDWAWQVQGV